MVGPSTGIYPLLRKFQNLKIFQGCLAVVTASWTPSFLRCGHFGRFRQKFEAPILTCQKFVPFQDPGVALAWQVGCAATFMVKPRTINPHPPPPPPFPPNPPTPCSVQIPSLAELRGVDGLEIIRLFSAKSVFAALVPPTIRPTRPISELRFTLTENSTKGSLSIYATI